MAEVDNNDKNKEGVDASKKMNAELLNSVQSLIVIVTGCLCFLIVILGVFILMALKVIQPSELGSYSSIATGGGLVGFGSLCVLMVRTAMNARDEQ